MIFSWNRIFTSVVGGTGVFSMGTYFFTREGLEPSIISKIYIGQDEDKYWSILMTRLKEKDDSQLHNIFLKAKNGSGVNNLAQTCRKARKWTTSSLFHTNNLLESNAQEFCILRMIDIVKNDVFETTKSDWDDSVDKENKSKWDTNAENLIAKAKEDEGKPNHEQNLIGLFLLIGNKLNLLKIHTNKHKNVKMICHMSYSEIYLPSKTMKLSNIKTYCNKNPQPEAKKE